MEQVDAVVIGAGVVGLAIARALARAGREVVVLEAHTAIGTETSSRNSEVIHAGLYYPSGSLKARLGVRGRDALYAYCAERGIAHRRCGKLIVATDTSQLAALERLRAQALANGVADVVRLDAGAARALEPALSCVAALHSPSTGIVDSHGLMLALRGDAEDHGAMIAFASPVRGGRAVAGGIELDVGGAQPMRLAARSVVNSAGLHAPALASRIDGLDARHVPAPHFCKGSYFALVAASTPGRDAASLPPEGARAGSGAAQRWPGTGTPTLGRDAASLPPEGARASSGAAQRWPGTRSPFSRLVYPMHDAAGLGVHLTLDLAGEARFGPDTEWLADDAPLDYRVDPRRAEAFVAAIRRYWPALPDNALAPAYAGIRPKIVGPDEPAADFVIAGPVQHGVAGLVNLFGIESPGLTAALAIGDEVLAKLAGRSA